MKDYQLIIDYKSLNLVEDLNNYSWKKDGEEPIDRYNHLMYACRYMINDRLKEQSGFYYIN